MTSQFVDEFRRMQNAVTSTITRLYSATIPEHQQQQHDEETPIIQRPPEMPGGFVTIPQLENTIPETTSPSPSIENTIFDKINKGMTIVFITTILIFLIPLYIIFRLFLYILFFILSIIIKIQRHGYKTIRNNDPINISRRFIMRFDDRIGNKSKNILEIDDSLQTGTNTVTNNSLIPSNNNLNKNVSTLIPTTSSLSATGLVLSSSSLSPSPPSPPPSLSSTTSNLPDSVINESHLHEIERPDFLECSYSQALYIVKKEMTWLMVYIESDKNKESIDFTHDVLINKKFLKFIKDRNILIWGGDICDSEAFQTCNQFNITKLPFLGLLCLTVNQIPTSSGIQQSAPVLSLVSKIQGYKNLNTTLNKLDKSYKKYNPVVSQLKLTNSVLNHDLTRTAYENSIQRNQQTRQERSNNNSNSNNSNSNNNITTNESHSLRAWLKWRKSQLRPECNEPGQYSRIAIKLPDGRRIQLKINKDCSLEEIYAIVECNYLNDVRIDESVTYNLPTNHSVHQYPFDIYSLMPKELLPSDTYSTINNNPLIFPNANLIVELKE
ncbi:hypothetical protein C6P40_005051 [Pichia californica]|uniref:UBX domain-containing protein n=1 Tax=Pichia californica TaxID=460514 RepID=A0A9P6WLY1_9ASCO|nr:hypothetical protein C6P40_005051 [[Candida] californica]